MFVIDKQGTIMHSALFTPAEMRGVTLRNRICIAPMCMYSGENGNANDWHLMHYGQYLVGGHGLLLSEATAVEPEGRISPKCLGIWNDDNEQAFKRIVEFNESWGNTVFGVQLAHAGRKASVAINWEGGNPIGPADGGWLTKGPSALAFADHFPAPEVLDAAGMVSVKAAFVDAAKRSDRAGLDVIEVHAAHGYLLHQFLSPISNVRSDSYGGSLENRMRFPLEVFEAVRAAFDQNKPVGIRVSATDWVDGGLSVDDTVAFGKELKKLECDFIHVSSGANVARAAIPVGPGYHVEMAARIRAETGLFTIAVGMISDPLQAETIVRTGQADMVGLARTMLYNTHWTWQAAVALGQEAAYPPQYLRAHPSAMGIAVPGTALRAGS